MQGTVARTTTAAAVSSADYVYTSSHIIYRKYSGLTKLYFEFSLDTSVLRSPEAKKRGLENDSGLSVCPCPLL